MWITWQLIRSLAEASEHQANTARIQKALATCSQALLTGRDEQPLTARFQGPPRRHRGRLCVYRHQPGSRRRQCHVGDRGRGHRGECPHGPDSFDEGDYSQFPQIIEILSAGRPARIG